MHPLWQIKQVVTIDSERDLDRNNCFGGRGSAGIYISFNGLVTWIAKNIRFIADLWTYMDDSFGIDEEDNVVWYHRYERYMPRNQAKLLSLWDELGIPHEPHKQLSGGKLTITGIEINANSLTFTLPAQALDDLLSELKAFTARVVKKRGACWTLRRWQRLAGWMNWSFNVFPMIRPALNNLYPKIAGKDQPLMKIWVNEVRSDLQWAMRLLRNSLGVRLLSTVSWNSEDADEIIFCDACMEGLAFWYPSRRQGFYSPVPAYQTDKTIFYYEALTATSAVDNLRERGIHHSKIVLFTDSMNTVDIFNSLKCQAVFNPLLLFCVDTSISNKLDLRVLHVPGVENEVADAISRRNFGKALRLVPELQISLFQPPQRATLGAAEK